MMSDVLTGVSAAIHRRQELLNDTRDTLVAALISGELIVEADTTLLHLLKAQEPVLRTIRSILNSKDLSDEQKLALLQQEADLQTAATPTLSDATAFYTYYVWTGLKQSLAELIATDQASDY